MLSRTARICRQCRVSAIARPLIRLPLRPVTTDAFADTFSVQKPSENTPSSTASWVGPDGAPLDDFYEASVEEEGEEIDPPEDDIPWYLQIEEPLTQAPLRPDPIPPIPDDAPAILPRLLEYIYHDMGLDYLSLLDLRALETSTALGPNLIMIIGTGRSERHLQVAGSRLTRWLRREHKIPALASGLISPAEVKVKLRRLRKRAQMVGGSAGAAFEGRAHGLSTGWVVVNLGTLGENKGEQAKLDEFGRMSGFGRVVEGCTVVVQCLTERKREQLDLEGLWKGNLEKNKRFLERLERGPQSGQDVESESVGLESSRPASSGPSFRTFSRSFSTMASTPTAPSLTSSTPFLASSTSLDPAAAALATRIQHALTTPSPISQQEFCALFRYALTNPHASLPDNIATAESLIRAMAERGFSFIDNDMLVPLVATVAHMAPLVANVDSNKNVGALHRMQANFELLLSSSDLPCPSEQHLSTLLKAYASQQNWPRFWSTFETPMRHSKPRSAELYTRMLDTALASNNSIVCADAARASLQYLSVEVPPVALDRPLCLALLRCIAVADPLAYAYVEDAWREMGFDVAVPAHRGRGRGGGEFAAALARVRDLWRGE